MAKAGLKFEGITRLTGSDCDSDCGSDFSGTWWQFPPLRNALAAGVIAVAAFILRKLDVIGDAPATAAYLISIPVGGWYWAQEAVEEFVEERAVGIGILMIAATLGTGILGLWEEAATLVVLYGGAEGLEEFAFARTRKAIRALLDLAPAEARLLRDGKESTVKADTLIPGDRFVVRPGESVATDGVVVSGHSSVNEAPVTGESTPVEKTTDSQVFAASINGDGALTIEVTKAFADNSLSRIIHMVEEAQEQKGRAQQWIDRFSHRYSPSVLIAAVLLVMIPWFLDLSVGFWAHRAVVLLVAAAPCALIMSMPMAMAAGIGAAGRRGILIKGGAPLEHLGVIKVVAFDKTGTLTSGKPVVTDLIPIGTSETELLSAAASLEHYSQHPLARAIILFAEGRGITILPAEQFESLPGAGARGRIGQAQWTIANPRWFETEGLRSHAATEQIAILQKQGKTVIVIASESQVRGVIALRDEPRREAKEAIAALHRFGVRTAMLTGDNQLAAETIAQELGIDDVRAELKPDDKVAAVRDLQRQHGPVLMVGDGVNDAPALASAHCGMAMGTAGTDAAIEAADIALMADDLHKVVEALALGQAARRISLQNIAFSIGVLVVLIPLAVFGLIGVAICVLVHEAAELLAVANGLRAGWPAQASRAAARR